MLITSGFASQSSSQACEIDPFQADEELTKAFVSCLALMARLLPTEEWRDADQ
jgi:hypothetical protein